MVLQEKKSFKKEQNTHSIFFIKISDHKIHSIGVSFLCINIFLLDLATFGMHMPKNYGIIQLLTQNQFSHQNASLPTHFFPNKTEQTSWKRVRVCKQIDRGENIFQLLYTVIGKLFRLCPVFNTKFGLSRGTMVQCFSPPYARPL